MTDHVSCLHRNKYTVSLLFRFFGVSRSGYYAALFSGLGNLNQTLRWLRRYGSGSGWDSRYTSMRTS